MSSARSSGAGRCRRSRASAPAGPRAWSPPPPAIMARRARGRRSGSGCGPWCSCRRRPARPSSGLLERAGGGAAPGGHRPRRVEGAGARARVGERAAVLRGRRRARAVRRLRGDRPRDPRAAGAAPGAGDRAGRKRRAHHRRGARGRSGARGGGEGGAGDGAQRGGGPSRGLAIAPRPLPTAWRCALPFRSPSRRCSRAGDADDDGVGARDRPRGRRLRRRGDPGRGLGRSSARRLPRARARGRPDRR